MNIAIFPFSRTGSFAEVLGKNFSGREPANEKGAHISMKGGDDIIALQGGGIADCDGFHPVAGIAPTDDAPLPVERRDSIL